MEGVLLRQNAVPCMSVDELRRYLMGRFVIEYGQ